MEGLHLEQIDKNEVLRYLGYRPGVHAPDRKTEELIGRASAVVLEAELCIRDRGISDMIVGSGYINADFADVKRTMENSGVAHMGVGVAKGDNKASDAVKAAIESPLLETSITGARNVLINITGGKDLTMFDANQVMQIANELVVTDAEIIFGVVIDENLDDEMRVTVVATGFDSVTPVSYTHLDVYKRQGCAIRQSAETKN